MAQRLISCWLNCFLQKSKCSNLRFADNNTNLYVVDINTGTDNVLICVSLFAMVNTC
jgi:hypothetical protein